MSILYKVNEINNKRFPDEEPSYSVSLVSYGNISTEKLAEEMSEMSSFTTGDMKGIIDNLVILIADHLSTGETVTLDDLGTFSLSAELKRKITDPTTIRGNDLKLKRICFKSSPKLKRKVEKDIGFLQHEDMREAKKRKRKTTGFKKSGK